MRIKIFKKGTLFIINSSVTVVRRGILYFSILDCFLNALSAGIGY